jgi:hypothetical protein
VIRGSLAAFAAASAVALAITFVAVSQSWVADVDDVARSLVTRWLPFALVVATLLTAVVAIHLDDAQRQSFLLRHFALYLTVPALLLLLRLGPVSNGELGVVYIGIAFALALHALAGVWSAFDRLSDRRVALLLGVTMLAVGFVILPYDRSVAPTASDEPHYLIVTQSLVLDHDLDLANDYAGTRYFEFYPEKLPDIHGIVVGNAIYSIRDLGLPLLSVVPFAIAGRTGVLAMLCLVGALLAVQLFLMLRDLRFDQRVAFLAVAATVFVHPILTYTTQIYPDLIAALVFVTAARLLSRGMLASTRELALASGLTGTLPWLSTRAWFVAVGLGLVIGYCALRPRRDLARRVAAAGALPFAALVLALSYLNWREFGIFIPSAGYFLLRDYQPVLVYTPWVGTIGLLFDGAFGLIPRAAVYLLAFLGVAALWRRARRGHAPEIAALALPWALSFLYIASIAYWYADGGPASRYLLATLPLLVAAVAGGIETILAVQRGRDVLVGIVAALVAWSAFVTYVLAVLPELRYDYAPDIRAGALARLWLLLGRIIRPDPESFFPVMLRLNAEGIALALVWVAIAAALVVIGVRLRRTGPALTVEASPAALR